MHSRTPLCNTLVRTTKAITVKHSQDHLCKQSNYLYISMSLKYNLCLLRIVSRNSTLHVSNHLNAFPCVFASPVLVLGRNNQYSMLHTMPWKTDCLSGVSEEQIVWNTNVSDGATSCRSIACRDCDKTTFDKVCVWIQLIMICILSLYAGSYLFLIMCIHWIIFNSYST